ncbi:MAG: hypothetical protein IJO64_04805 [Clostridia bacterium]|nr:hypothetical protein [Clostridia bacterium]MBQ9848358.1 hypothetical protein [Clostridia bacterium]
MVVFLEVFISMLAALGVTLSIIELSRCRRAKKASFVCVCFKEELLENGLPDMLVICKNDAEQEEIIRRVCTSDGRKAFIKRI